MKNAAKIVSDAILGNDLRVVTVAGHPYTLTPPTIYRLAGAAGCLAPVAEATTISALLTKQKDIEAAARALSWFINGDETLAAELAHGTLAEVVQALKIAYTLLDVRDFLTLSTLARNVARTVAKQKQ